MNPSDIADATTRVAQKSKNVIGQQVDRQSTALGGALAQTARDLEQVSSNLRASEMLGGAAQLADWAADYVARAANYLSTGDTDRFIVDLESYTRERPWTVAASAAALGFVAARIVKSSSARRYGAAAANGSLATAESTADDARAGSSAPDAQRAFVPPTL